MTRDNAGFYGSFLSCGVMVQHVLSDTAEGGKSKALKNKFSQMLQLPPPINDNLNQYIILSNNYNKHLKIGRY